MGKPWTQEEKDSLREQIASFKSAEELRIKGRRYNGILTQAHKLGLSPLKNPPWTKEMDEVIVALRQRGLSCEQISHLDPFPVKRTAEAIRSRLGSLKVRIRKKKKPIKKWESGEKEIFFAFLRRFSNRFPVDLIAARFKVSEACVRANQRKLECKPSAEAMKSLPHHQKRWQKFRQGFSLLKIRAYEKKLPQIEEDFNNKADEYFCRHPDCMRKTCASCGKTYPASSKFFYFYDRKFREGSLKGVRRIYYRICILCTKKQRHQRLLTKRGLIVTTA